MIGDKVCAWIANSMPGVVEWIGGLSQWQLLAVALLGVGLIYAAYAAGYNLWLMCWELWAAGSAGHRWETWEEEPYADWMDAEIWTAEDCKRRGGGLPRRMRSSQ